MNKFINCFIFYRQNFSCISFFLFSLEKHLKNIALGFRIKKNIKWPMISEANNTSNIKYKMIHIHCEIFKHHCKAQNGKSVSPSAPLSLSLSPRVIYNVSQARQESNEGLGNVCLGVGGGQERPH